MNESQTLPAIELATKIIVSPDVLGAELGSETSLLNVKTGIYFTLNPVGASVWRKLQAGNTLAEINRLLLEEYEVEPQRCEDDLKQLVGELHSLGLVEFVAA